MKAYSFYKTGLFLLVFCSNTLSFAEDQDEQLTVNATTTDGQSQNDIQEANQLAEIFVLQKQLVYKLLQNIGIPPDKLSPDVKKAINKPQTTSIKAFKAFSYCLDFMDKGEFDKAREQCDEAIRQDPGFSLAQRQLNSIPDHQETMPEIVADHMTQPITVGLKPDTPEIIVLNNIPPDEPPVQLPSDLDAVNRDVPQVDPSSPACGNTGQCGFYSTFLTHSNPDGSTAVTSAPIMNRTAVSIPPGNESGNISINQIGQEDKGFLNLQVDPRNQTGNITAFQDGVSTQGQSTVSNGQLDRVVTNQFQTASHVKGLELGTYLAKFDNRASKGIDIFHSGIPFAEGVVTPIDHISSLGRVQYSGVANGDFSVNGQLVPCQGNCGHFTGTLNYGAANLETFRLDANAHQVEGNLTAAAQITATNVGLKPSGEFQFDQSNGSFKVGPNSEHLSAAQGSVAGRPFGNNAEVVGGVFTIHGGHIQGAGSFGGGRK